MEMNYDISTIIFIKNSIGGDLQKQRINARKERVYFRDREVWWVHFGLNIGFK